jgi:hypothetical protein
MQQGFVDGFCRGMQVGRVYGQIYELVKGHTRKLSIDGGTWMVRLENFIFKELAIAIVSKDEEALHILNEKMKDCIANISPDLVDRVGVLLEAGFLN